MPKFMWRLYFVNAYILVSVHVFVDAHIFVNAYILVSVHVFVDAYIYDGTVAGSYVDVPNSY